MAFRVVSWCFGVAVVALAACSPGGSSPSSPGPTTTAAAASPPSDPFGCSSPDVKASLDELVWEGVGSAVTDRLARDRVADVVAAGKAHFTLSLQGMATITGQNGARPTCEAAIVGTDRQELNADSNWVQRATQADPSVKVKGKDVIGSVRYVVQPSDDGKTFRVTAEGLDTFALALAGLSLSFSNNELLAKREAERADNTATPTPALPAVSAEPPVGTSAPAQQASAGSDYEAADKALNAAYAAARAHLDDAGKIALRDEQRAWIKTRDAACSEARITADSKGDIAGGSAMALELSGCKARMTQERTKQLLAKG